MANLQRQLDDAKARRDEAVESAGQELESWKAKHQEVSVNERLTAQQLETRDGEVAALQTSVASLQMQLKQLQQVQAERDAVLMREDTLRQDLAAAERRHAAAVTELHDQLTQAEQRAADLSASLEAELYDKLHQVRRWRAVEHRAFWGTWMHARAPA